MGIDPTSDRPLYQQVADLLRERIMSGPLSAHTKLPSETELIDELDVSRETARGAYNVLRAEGLVYSQRGRGSFVQERRRVSRVAPSRYQAGRADTGPPETAFTRDHDVGWAGYRLDRTFEETPAVGMVAELFGVDEGTPVLERQFVFYANDQPQQSSVSYLLGDMVRGTPVADPANEPWPGGTIAQLATLGVVVTDIDQVVTARMPDPHERRRLHIPEGVPVLCVIRTMLAGGRPVEVNVEIVMPADRNELRFRTQVSGA
jgi:GntR family transcriptional regulator